MSDKRLNPAGFRGKRLCLLGVLAAASFLGNWASVSLFFGVDLVFGSVAALVAARLFGLWGGLFVSAAGGAYTLVLWGQPYAALIFLAETAFVARFQRRFRGNLVLADAVYWLALGAPLIMAAYAGVLGMRSVPLAMILLKQPVNGILNAFVADILLLFVGSRLDLVFPGAGGGASFRRIVSHLVMLAGMLPSIVILGGEGRREFRETESSLSEGTLRAAQAMASRIDQFLDGRLAAVAELARASEVGQPHPGHVQELCEHLVRSSRFFHNIYVADASGTTTAFFPPVNEKGGSTLGLNFADRPYYAELRKTLRPVVSDVFMGRGGIFQPIFSISVPIFRDGVFAGYALGAVRLDRLAENVRSSQSTASEVVLLDRSDRVVLAINSTASPLDPWLSPPELRRSQTPGRPIQVFPEVSRSAVERWGRSRMVGAVAISVAAGWRVVAVSPVAPHQTALFGEFVQIMAFLAGILLALLFAGSFISRIVSEPLARLAQITRGLSGKIEGGQPLELPASQFEEVSSLVETYHEMADALAAQLRALNDANRTLESRVAERTRDIEESEGKYRAIFNNQAYSICMFDMETLRFLDANPSFEKLYGYSKEEMLAGMTVADITAEIQGTESSLRELKCGGAVIIPLRYHRKKGGEVFPVEIVGGRYFSKGRVVMFGLSHDITERKRVEERVKQLSLQLKTILDTLTVGVSHLKNRVVVRCNPAHVKMFGYSEEEARTHDTSIYYAHAEDSGRVGAEGYACLARGETYITEAEMKRKDGTRFWCQITGRAINPDDLAEGSIWMLQDIEGRKRAEEATRLHLAVMETVAEGIFIVGVDDNTIKWTNRKLEELFGYGPGEMVGMQVDDVNAATGMTPTEPRVSIVDPLLKDGNWNGEIKNIKKNGTPFWCNAHVSLFDHPEFGKVMVSAHTDITGRKEMDLRLQHALDRYEWALVEMEKARDEAVAANRAKGRFLATMSHEIRTPMHGVLGMVGLLLETRLEPDQRRYTETARDSAENLLSLINDILDFSKIESGKLQLETTGFHLPALLEEVARSFSLQAERKSIRLETGVSPEVPADLVGDPGRLRQVLFNLVGNAIKFTSKGMVSVEAILESRSEGRARLRFDVTDTGIGIAPGTLGTLFSPFVQADSSTTRKYGGTGLGLAISKELAKLLGGEIGVRSVQGEGSTFWFTADLGIAQPDGDATEEAPSRAGPMPDALSRWAVGPGLKPILLVEDNIVNQEVALGIFRHMGLQADLAADGLEAVRLLSERRYGLVLMDIQMPEMDGFEASSIIRDPASRVLDHAVPVIAMTAHAMPEHRELCRRAGMDDYLAKPVTRQKLEQVIAKWLGQARRRAGREAERAETHQAVEVTPAGAGVFDIEFLKKQTSGDTEFMRFLLQRFMSDIPARVGSVSDSVRRADYDAARQGAHAIKGAAASIGANRLRDAAEMVEKAGLRGDPNEIRPLSRELEQRYSELSARLQSLIEQMAPGMVPGTHKQRGGRA